MVIYNNFLNTPYDLSIPTIVLGNVKNYLSVPKDDKAFIIYCNPIEIRLIEFVLFFRRASLNFTSNLKKDISFRGKRIFDMRLNLYSVFTGMQVQVNEDVGTLSEPDLIITKQKFFAPYYNRASYKTQYWSILTEPELLIQLNLIYDVGKIDFSTNLFKGLRLIINYDLYCPYFDYPIRFVFQYIIQ